MTENEKSPHTAEFAWKSFLAGGLAGCAAKTAIAPLDRVKILFQTSNPHFEKYSGSFSGIIEATRAITRDHGVFGLFQGHSATLLRVFPYAAIKFMAYEQYRGLIIPTKQQETPLRRLLAGSLAGVTSVFFSYPLELIRVRLAIETSNSGPVSLFKTTSLIYHEQSHFVESGTISKPLRPLIHIANFYRGFLPSVYGIIPYAGVSFLAYDTTKDLATLRFLRPYTLQNPDYQGEEKPQLRAWTKLVCGGISGALAQTCSYPFEMIRRQMQVAGVMKSTETERIEAFKSTFGTAKYIYQTKGFKGFFVGLSIGFIKVVPMFAVSFYTYEYLKQIMGLGDVGMGSGVSFG